MKKQRTSKLMLNKKMISKLITGKIKGGTDVGSGTLLHQLPGVGDSEESQCAENCTQTVLNCE